MQGAGIQIRRGDMRKRNVAHFLTRPQGRLENTNTNMTFSMPRETAASLRRIALAKGTDLQGLIELAVNEWLARQPLFPEALVSPPRSR
jgi:hypothetical protein